jgi:hypothetical protein
MKGLDAPFYQCFTGLTCISQFLEALEQEVDRLCLWNEEHSHKVMEELTSLQLNQHFSATTCFMCKKPFDIEKNNKILEHCHITGKYRGAACQPCNTKARLQRSTVPVIFHNFKGYDAHHIIKEGVSTRPGWELGVIATTSESYLCLRACWGSWRNKNKIAFIDSLQFLKLSFASLVKLCPALPLTESLPWPSSITKGKATIPNLKIFCSRSGWYYSIERRKKFSSINLFLLDRQCLICRNWRCSNYDINIYPLML